MTTAVRSFSLLSAALAVLASSSPARGLEGAPAPRTLDECAARQRDRPGDYAPYQCYWSVSRQQGQWEEASRRLEALLAIDPRNDKARLYLGVIRCDHDDDEGPELVRQALRGFARDEDLRGQVYGQITLAFWYDSLRDSDAAAIALDAALDAARRSGDPDLVLMAEIRQGWRAHREADYARAYAIFHRLVESIGPAPLTADTWQAVDGLAATAWQIQRPLESLEAYGRLAAFLAARGARFELALLLDNRVSVARGAGLPRETWEPWARAALAEAQATRNTRALAQAHRHLGSACDGEEARRHLEAAIRSAREANLREDLALALAELGSRRARRPEPDRSAGLALLDDAVDVARRNVDRWLRLEIRRRRALVLWDTGQRARAREEFDRLFDELEQWRALQRESSVRVRVFAPWSQLYEAWPALLLRDAPDDAVTVGDAFAALERLRARELVEVLGEDPPGDNPLERQRRELVQLIAAVQQRLLDPASTAAVREAALAELERVEIGEIEVRAEIARRTKASSNDATPATLAEVQDHLGRNQAMLVFLWSARPDGERRNWLLRLTSGGARALPLPDAREIENAVRGLPGVVARRDGSEVEATARLGRELLSHAVAGLAREVDELVIVPDGALFLLPFELLRVSAGTPPLGQRFGLTIAPSATAWLRARQREAPLRRDVLALADPTLPGSEGRVALSRDWSRLGAVGLGALPFARSEAREIEATVGKVVLRFGEEATERFVKEADLSHFGIVHFAAHALVDTDRPERSALLLAPGSNAEDGLLQPREIARLDWRGRVVVMSGCRSVAGEIMAGEGPVGLAHAFLRAGARAVIGSVWPVRDDDAAKLIAAFYERLATGESLESAMRGARQRRQQEGAPAAAWAGFVVIGDGAWVPFGGGIASDAGTTITIALGLVVATAFVLGGAAWRGRRRSGRRGRPSSSRTQWPSSSR